MKKLLLLAMLMVGCGSDDSKSKAVEPPIDVFAVKIDVFNSTRGGFSANVIANTDRLAYELSKEGYFAMVNLSTDTYPGQCDVSTAEVSDSTTLVQVSNLLPGIYYARVCMANKNGYVSTGITKQFEIVDPYQ